MNTGERIINKAVKIVSRAAASVLPNIQFLKTAPSIVPDHAAHQKAADERQARKRAKRLQQRACS